MKYDLEVDQEGNFRYVFETTAEEIAAAVPAPGLPGRNDAEVILKTLLAVVEKDLEERP